MSMAQKKQRVTAPECSPPVATNLLSAGSDPEVPADKRLSVTLASQSARSVSDGAGAINQTRPREISPGFLR